MRLHVQEQFVVGGIDFIIVSIQPLQVQLVSFLSIEFIQGLPDMFVVPLAQQSLVVSSLHFNSNKLVFICRQKYNPRPLYYLILLYITALVQ